jgi:hypothetical protein
MGLRLSRLEVVIQAVLGLSAAAVTLAAAPFGLNAVCLALLIRLALLIVMPLWMLRRAAGIKPLSIFLAPAGPAAAAAAMGVCVMTIAPWLARSAGKMLALPLLAAIGAILYSVLALALAPKEAALFLNGFKPIIPKPEEQSTGAR